MSYNIMPSQRGFDHPQPDLATLSPLHNQNHRMNVSQSSYDEYDHPQPPPAPLSLTSAQNGPSTSSHPEFTSSNLPKVGETRCYWVLLSSELHFIYMDPVLQSHLAEQAELLIGKSLLSFVHPDEQATAKQDVGNVIESRTLHGSVTRVRFSRLSRVRRQLGYQGPPPAWSGAAKISIDENYMVVDLVINWAAEGLVLCFIHASVDLNPQDNDEKNKTVWTNWCGTPSMGMDQIRLLYQRLIVCLPHGNYSRVFQILSNSSERHLLLSWPPDDEHRQGPTGRDFAKLIEDIRMGPDAVSHDAKTSCTRRYRADQAMPGSASRVATICLPYGTIIFACHEVNEPPRGTGPPMQLGYNSNTYNGSSSQHYYESNNQYVLPPLVAPSSYDGRVAPHSHHTVATNYAPQSWSSGGESPASHPHYAQWNSPNTTQSLPTSVSHLRSGSYPQHQQGHWPSSTAYLDSGNDVQQPYDRPISPQYDYPEGGEAAPHPSPDVVPPPKRRVSPGARDQYSSGGKSAGNRPVGVLRCSSCKATQSPEWRKGPSGKKELCNACGLRYARSRAKKEGNLAAQRRRKEKAMKHGSSTPPSSTIRRNYDDASLVSTSDGGSAQNSPIYHNAHFEGLSPSPSPPAGVSFVHYNHSNQHHKHPESRPLYASNSTSFYSMPSPLSNPPVLNPQHGHHNNLPHTPPSRLENISQFPERLSPLLIPNSPPLQTMPPASFERDRDRDRQNLSAPSVDARSSSVRSILLTE